MASSTYGTYGGRTWNRPSAGAPGGQVPGYPAGFQSRGPPPPGPAGFPGQRQPDGGLGAPAHSILRSGGLQQGRARSKINIWELIFIPWVLLALILVCYLLAGANGSTGVLWVIPIMLLGLSAFWIRYHYKSGNNPEVVLGVLCVAAVVIGLVVGVFSVTRSLNEYHRLSMGASYFNVLPSEPALGKRDATTIDFTNATLVDTQRTFGFIDTRMTKATTYCVAPVATGEESARARVQYFAAGINCCESRGNFQCGEATNANAHGAVVLPEADAEGFGMAVRGSQSAFNFPAGEQYLLLRWHHDPVGYRNSLWHSTVTLYLIFGGVYLVISAMIGCTLMPVFAGK